MQTSKYKYIRRVIAFIVLTAMVIGIFWSVGEVLSPLSFQVYFDRDMDEIKQKNQTVDMMFVGASRVYMSFVPSVFEEKLNQDCVIVAGTAEQPVCGTYYLTKDYVEKYHPKHVVIGVTWNMLLDEPVAHGKAIVYDRLSLKNKILFAQECFREDKLLMLKAVRYKGNIYNLPAITDEKKRAKANGYLKYNSSDEYYSDKGFVYTYHFFDEGNIPIYDTGPFCYSNDRISEENLTYLHKCVDLCTMQGIKVSLVTAPMSMPQLYNIEGYQDSIVFFSEFAEEKGISYYNLNYLRGREELLTDDKMRDRAHVNAKGAKTISEIYADILLKEKNGEDVSHYFYRDLDELKQDVHRIVGVLADISYQEDSQDSNRVAHLTFKSLHNEDVVPYYRVEVRYGQGEYEVVSDWSAEEEVDIQISADTGYDIKVRAKTGIAGGKEAYQIYSY